MTSLGLHFDVVCITLLVIIYNLWDDRDCSVCFKVIVLLVLDSDKRPLRTSKTFTHD